MNKSLRIACDGEAASGKSTGAKLVSKKYSLVNEKLIDTFEFDLPSSLVIKHEAELKQQYASFSKANDNVDEKIKEIAIKRCPPLHFLLNILN